MSEELEASSSRLAEIVRWVGLIVGPLAAVIVYLATAPSEGGNPAGTLGLTEPGRRVLAVSAWMAVWWLTEALPISVTALLPLVVLPLLRVGTMKETAAPYAEEIIFLFLGGFILGEALRSSGLHRRIAIATLVAVGATPSRIVGGVMLATCLISMWVSNTATTLMMLPIGMSIVGLVERAAAGARGGSAPGGWTDRDTRNLGAAIVLGIAYAASIGGMGTPIGTPPNGVMLGFARERLGQSIDFGTWMLAAIPVVALFLPLAWLLLSKVLHPVRSAAIPGGREMLEQEKLALGRMSRAEIVTLSVFLVTAAAWILREPLVRWLGLTLKIEGRTRPVELLTDAGIAIGAAILLFLIPVQMRPRRGVVTFEEAEKLPWGILLLFGGGLSIASAMERTKVDVFLGGMFEGLSGLPSIVIVLVLVTAIVFLGELASNSAMVTAIMPVLIAAAPRMGMEPLPLMLAATLAASCGFMLPVATPPNALAYATKRVTQGQMIRAGFGLDLIGIVLIVVAMALVGGRVLSNGP